jgi:hypothetical protein
MSIGGVLSCLLSLVRTPVFLIAAAVLAHCAHLAVDHTPLPEPAGTREALPSMRALSLLSLGYRSLAADYYWLRLISHFGDRHMDAQAYPNLGPFLDSILTLDPYFADAYFFAGNVLTLKGQDPEHAIALLERGARCRPDDWHILMLLGFERYYFHGDYLGGAEMLGAAAKLPGSPALAGLLAARLSAQAHAPEIGIAMIDALLAEVKDPKVRAEYAERRKLLELEVYLNILNEGARRYRERLGESPKEVEDLVRAHILVTLPPEPLGGRYYVGPGGTIVTTNEGKRLRLSQQARRAAR